MPLFEVAILEMPTPTEFKEGKEEKLAFGPEPVVANDEQTAAIRAVMDNRDIDVKQERMKVLVRPFA